MPHPTSLTAASAAVPQCYLCDDRLCYCPTQLLPGEQPSIEAVRYLALDRIPVRPLPHRQHVLSPMETGSSPDIGISLISSKWVCLAGCQWHQLR